MIKEVIDAKDKGEPGFHLQTYLRRLRGDGQFENAALQKARVATVVHLAKHRQSLVELLSEKRVASVEGELGQIVAALKERNVILLPGGALEHYLPSYSGEPLVHDDPVTPDVALEGLTE